MPGGASDVVDQALSEKLEKRFGSCGEFANQFVRGLHENQNEKEPTNERLFSGFENPDNRTEDRKQTPQSLAVVLLTSTAICIGAFCVCIFTNNIVFACLSGFFAIIFAVIWLLKFEKMN